MDRTYPVLTEPLIEFIRHQPVFFVGTAPICQDGLIKVSPKGLKTLAVIDPHTVAYLDLTGSGIETVAHLKENGRIVLMFCAFEGSPKNLRLHGRGDVIEPADPPSTRWQHFPSSPSWHLRDCAHRHSTYRGFLQLHSATHALPA